jgi:hypothetical protein
MAPKKELSAKRVVKIVLICIVVGFFLFVFFLFQTCKTKSTNIGNKDPFKDLIGKELVLKRPVRLFMEKYPTRKEFPYVMADTNLYSWQNYTAALQATEPEIKLSDSIQENSKVVFEKATQYTPGVSGFSRSKLFGTLTSTEGKTYKVEMQWGELNSSLPWKGSDKAYRFELAPWQTERDTASYYLPTAQWW